MICVHARTQLTKIYEAECPEICITTSCHPILFSIAHKFTNNVFTINPSPCLDGANYYYCRELLKNTFSNECGIPSWNINPIVIGDNPCPNKISRYTSDTIPFVSLQKTEHKQINKPVGGGRYMGNILYGEYLDAVYSIEVNHLHALCSNP